MPSYTPFRNLSGNLHAVPNRVFFSSAQWPLYQSLKWVSGSNSFIPISYYECITIEKKYQAFEYAELVWSIIVVNVIGDSPANHPAYALPSNATSIWTNPYVV